MKQMETARADRTLPAIAIILASVLTMAFADAVVKLVSADLTVWQVFAARSLAAIPILLAFLLARGTRFKVKSPRWVLVRSALLVLTWLAFYASLPALSLSVAAVAVYTNPIMTALFSAALLGERVSGRQWGGVSLGFLGVAAVLRPGADAFSWFALLPLFAAACYALAMVLTRGKCRDDPPLVLSLNLHAGFLAVGLVVSAALAVLDLDDGAKAAMPFLLGDWAPMGARELGLMALLGALSAAYFIGVARAYQIAAPSIVATFDYGYLVSAALWGFVFFAEIPDSLTILGMVLITAAGLLVAAPSRKHRIDSRSAR